MFPENGSPMLLPMIFVTMMIGATMNLSSSIMVSSMVADLVEDSQVKTGRRSEGLILSADILPQKVLAAFAVIIPGLMLSWIGFPKDAKPGQVLPEIISAMGLCLHGGGAHLHPGIGLHMVEVPDRCQSARGKSGTDQGG